MAIERGYSGRTDERRVLWSMKMGTRLKYLATLAARAKGITLAAFIEEAMYSQFASIIVEDDREAQPGEESSYEPIRGRSLTDLADELYRDTEPDRFLALMNIAPWLASDGEMRLNSIIRHSDYFAPGRVTHRGRVKEHWTVLSSIRDGKADVDILSEDQQPKGAMAFGLLTGTERNALYKSDPATFKRMNDAYSKAMKGRK